MTKMRNRIILKMLFRLFNRSRLFLLLALTVPISSLVAAQDTGQSPIILHAAHVFDGTDLRTNTSVLVVDGKIAQIDSPEAIKSSGAKVIDLGDATLLPGFIELHAHLAFQNIPADTVLKHGITTLRDVGGPVHKPYGGDGSLRVLTSGLIITAPDVYPIPGMGAANIATPVSTEEQARETVRNLIDGGAVVIKVALEPGGEHGAPWASGHGHEKQPAAEHALPHHKPAHKPAHKAADEKQAWPLLPKNIVKAIVDEAHKHDRKVSAHIGEEKGAQIAINAGIDEWAHVPCDTIPEPLLKKTVAQHVKIVTTMDTLSKCPGLAHNVRHPDLSIK